MSGLTQTSAMFVTAQETTEEPEYFFDVTILVRNSTNDLLVQERAAAMDIIAGELKKVKINATVIKILNWTEFDEKILPEGIYPYPTYEKGGFDIFEIGFGGSAFEPDSPPGLGNWKALSVWAEYFLERDIVGYGVPDTELESLIYDYYDVSESDEERLQAFNELQNHMFENLPYIPYLEDEAVLFCDSELDQSMMQALSDAMSSAQLTIPWEMLDLGSKQNITFTGLASAITPYLALNYEVLYHNVWWRLITNLLHQKMYERDVTDPSIWIPVIAETLPEWSPDKTQATIKLREDVYFSDGVKLNSSDVVESYNFYLHPNSDARDKIDTWTNYILDWTVMKDFMNPLANFVTAIDEFTVQFDFTKTHVNIMGMLSKPIIPTHIWGTYQNSYFNDMTYPSSLALQEFLIDGNSPLVVGAGPYALKEIIFFDPSMVPADVHTAFSTKTFIFEAVPNYWRSDLKIKNIKLENNLFMSNLDEVEMIINGDSDFSMSQIWNDPTIAETNSEVSIVKSPAFGTKLIALNMNHSIFGTGRETPLGLYDQDRQSEAAKYVRQAISHAIPREDIISNIFDGQGRATSIPFSYRAAYRNQSITYHEYNLDKARELLFLAGYGQIFGEEERDFIDTITDPLILATIGGVALVSGIFVNRFTSFRWKNLIQRRSDKVQYAKDYVDEAKKIAKDSTKEE
jgi:ABC-type transport system substrate-binding protein